MLAVTFFMSSLCRPPGPKFWCEHAQVYSAKIDFNTYFKSLTERSEVSVEHQKTLLVNSKNGAVKFLLDSKLTFEEENLFHHGRFLEAPENVEFLGSYNHTLRLHPAVWSLRLRFMELSLFHAGTYVDSIVYTWFIINFVTIFFSNIPAKK